MVSRVTTVRTCRLNTTYTTLQYISKWLEPAAQHVKLSIQREIHYVSAESVVCASQPTASQSGPYWMRLRYQQAEYIACNPALVTGPRLSGFPFHTSTTVSGLTCIQGDTSGEHSIVSTVPVTFVTHEGMNTHHTFSPLSNISCQTM